ncbi:MAG: hypothetical protein HGA61_02090 [Candidatus Moranbacteria bacterium]|nr:hypothetical protein [Candidatus Moranbacteria bacterium]
MNIEGKIIRAVENVIESMEKVQLKDYDWRDIRDIERDFRDEKLRTFEEVMERLKKIEHLWVGLDRNFRNLEKEVKKVL